MKIVVLGLFLGLISCRPPGLSVLGTGMEHDDVVAAIAMTRAFASSEEGVALDHVLPYLTITLVDDPSTVCSATANTDEGGIGCLEDATIFLKRSFRGCALEPTAASLTHELGHAIGYDHANQAWFYHLTAGGTLLDAIEGEVWVKRCHERTTL